MIKHSRPALTTLAALSLACQTPGADAEPQTVWALVDETGSYAQRPEAYAMLDSMIAELGPGDRLVVRAITASSHDPSASVLDLSLPADTIANEFDPLAVAARQRRIARRDSLKSAASAELRRRRKINLSARRSDIVGAIVAAAQQARYLGRPSSLLLFTDGEQTAPDLPDLAPNLRGIDVFFLCFETRGGLAERERLREKWRARLDSWSARSVSFVPTGERFTFADIRRHGNRHQP